MKVQNKDTNVVYDVIRQNVLGSSNLWALRSSDGNMIVVNWSTHSGNYVVIEQ